jgi:hypothetical protein
MRAADAPRAQAARVLVYELLRAHAAHPAAALPRLLAALLAWPAALAPPPAAGGDPLARAVHAALADVVRDVLDAPACPGGVGVPADAPVTLLGPLAASTGEAVSGADVSAAAARLWRLGAARWGWAGLARGGAAGGGGAPQWAALQAAVPGVLRALRGGAAEHTLPYPPAAPLRALDLALACLGGAARSLPVRRGPRRAFCLCPTRLCSCRRPRAGGGAERVLQPAGAILLFCRDAQRTLTGSAA